MTTDHHRIALALNNVATMLQQLAVELDAASREQLREQLQPEPLAGVAEPGCGCSLYTRCTEHAADPRCSCNGPQFRSSACRDSAHRAEARAKPDRDPALLD